MKLFAERTFKPGLGLDGLRKPDRSAARCLKDVRGDVLRGERLVDRAGFPKAIPSNPMACRMASERRSSATSSCDGPRGRSVFAIARPFLSWRAGKMSTRS